MATTQLQDLALNSTGAIRYFLQRNATRKRVLKTLQRLQEAERKESSVEPLHLPMDYRVWVQRINRLWPMSGI
jgi:hypothetical protein